LSKAEYSKQLLFSKNSKDTTSYVKTEHRFDWKRVLADSSFQLIGQEMRQVSSLAAFGYTSCSLIHFKLPTINTGHYQFPPFLSKILTPHKGGTLFSPHAVRGILLNPHALRGTELSDRFSRVRH
jgi:hypothetical protein